MALLICPWSLTSDSTLSATVSSDLSRKPPVSPARTILTMIGGNRESGSASMASEKDEPPSTCATQACTALRSFTFSICSVTMFKARISETPAATMVASCRAVTAKSFLLGYFSNALMLISVLRPVPAAVSVRSVGYSPSFLMRSMAWSRVCASTTPFSLRWPSNETPL